MLLEKADKVMKKLTKWDVWCIKVASLLFGLFLITVWPAFHDAVMKAHWGWYLAAALILMIKPLMKWCKA